MNGGRQGGGGPGGVCGQLEQSITAALFRLVCQSAFKASKIEEYAGQADSSQAFDTAVATQSASVLQPKAYFSDSAAFWLS